MSWRKPEKPEKKVEEKPAPSPAPKAEVIEAAREAFKEIAPDARAILEHVVSHATAPAESCGNCRYFRQSDPELGGDCRRYPPERGEHTRHSANLWCGEWKGA